MSRIKRLGKEKSALRTNILHERISRVDIRERKLLMEHSEVSHGYLIYGRKIGAAWVMEEALATHCDDDLIPTDLLELRVPCNDYYFPYSSSCHLSLEFLLRVPN